MSDNDDVSKTALTSFRSADGLLLRGSFDSPGTRLTSSIVLVHGGGATREEGGFFTRLAGGLAERGVASLRFDLRGHGESAGRQEDLTLSGVVNDIHAAVTELRRLAGDVPVNVLGASFGGGICAYFTAHYPDDVAKLVLINPLINYKKRFVDDKPYWSNDQIDEVAGLELSQNGFLAHSPTFKLGRPLLNEVFYLRPDQALGQILAPTLVLHGTADTFIPVESSREHVTRIPADTRLIEVDGAQHGIAVHDDPGYSDPQTQAWQAAAIQDIADWVV
ncbi:alpha/beta fold hydrolase [Paractinoplanes ferrugineus]|uniref:Alpha/beta hydrolase n=1 Tax=Paractinoplanes ferrugineus TaxID=113564 RepID=A0A919MNF6_9ACTN|nr:alpha/beta fold hydrolase [Actinoplanes ferrugineus]GIE14222.1 alpha/beta hydrolase [Actinoplanes ferrugineus]